MLEKGDHADMTKIAFQVSPDLEIEEMERSLSALSVRCERRTSTTPGVSESVAFTDPRGILVEAFPQMSFHGRSTSDEGVSPLKIGHIASRVKDVQKMTAFYQDVLGFRVSDCSVTTSSSCGAASIIIR